jgi:hypothetical protein
MQRQQESMRIIVTVLLAGLCLIIGVYPLAYVLTDDRFGLLQGKPDSVVSNSWWRAGFHAHILSGGAALAVGWSQFVSGWRIRFPRLHRAVGSVYLLLVLVSGVAALGIAPFSSTGWVAALAFEVLAVIWLTVTVLAYRSILRRDVQRHKDLMVYSFSACCAAVTLRLWLPLLLLVLRLDFSVAYPIVAWLCWVPNLLVARLINSRAAAASR